MTERDDFKNLLELAKKGDPDAIDNLIRINSEQVMQAIRVHLGKRLRTKLESVDIYQTAMKSAVRSLNDFRGDDSRAFRKWLSKILLNDIRDKAGYFSAEKHSLDREQPIEKHLEGESRIEANIPADVETPSRLAVMGELEGVLEEAILKLPEEQRRIFLLKKQGKTMTEIARELDTKERTLYRQYSQALLSLRRFMEQKGYGATGRF